MKAIKVFDPSTYGLTTRSNLTAKRWYPSTITLPNGDIYIPGEPGQEAAAQERGRVCIMHGAPKCGGVCGRGGM
jgi:hypothetical protein